MPGFSAFLDMKVLTVGQSLALVGRAVLSKSLSNFLLMGGAVFPP